LVPGPCPTPPWNFVKIRLQLFQLSDRQTNRQTDRSENITSFIGGGNKYNSALVGGIKVAGVLQIRFNYCVKRVNNQVSIADTWQVQFDVRLCIEDDIYVLCCYILLGDHKYSLFALNVLAKTSETYKTFSSRPRPKTLFFVLEAPRDQDLGLEDDITG